MVPKVAIIGGGPGGLTLSRLLHRISIPNIVYEQEGRCSARNQGGTLDLHKDSGQHALHRAGLFDSFTKIMRQDDQGLRIADKTGKLFVNSTDDRGKPEIDRLALQELLLQSIPSEFVKWGSKLQKMEQSCDGGWNLLFSDGTKAGSFDLVVGADGAWSQVRKVLSTTVPSYSGISGVELRFASVDTKNKMIAELVGPGAYLALGDGKALLAQRNGDGSIRNYVMMRVPEDWVNECGIDFSLGHTAKRKLIQLYFSEWDERLKNLVDQADDEIIPRGLYMLPVGFKWESSLGVTLLGDAAHLMTPFTGEGVNTAMLDAVELAEEIERAKEIRSASEPYSFGGALAEATKRYEARMWKRTEAKTKETQESLEPVFHKDSPRIMLEKMMS